MNGSKILFNLIKILLRVNNEENDKGYFMEVEVQYLEKSHELHNDLPFIPETLKIENVEKFVTNLHDKAEYVIQIRNLKHALNHELVLKKVHKLIKFNQTAWLKPYIDMNTKLKQKTKIILRKIFSRETTDEKEIPNKQKKKVSCWRFHC